ncbi:hypothetical protein H7142_01415 [Candidatus Saccharibacteria bacterium]|nr:hypothetical protein [Candidatus Saccharibacteria bacterium]
MKPFALFGATLFGILGGYVPLLFGDMESMIGWSIIGSTVGGLVGIWVGVKLYKAIG